MIKIAHIGHSISMLIADVQQQIHCHYFTFSGIDDYFYTSLNLSANLTNLRKNQLSKSPNGTTAVSFICHPGKKVRT